MVPLYKNKCNKRRIIYMKKLLSTLSVIMIITSSASSVVSCSGVKAIPFRGYKTDGSDISLITDTGKKNDHSFNESTLNAGNAFVDVLNNVKNSSIHAVEPGNNSELKSAYALTIKKGANHLLLPGFQQQENVTRVSKLLGE